MSLKGKTVLLTGASMGIGEAIANAVAPEASTIILLSRSEEKLSSLANTLSSKFSNCKFIHRAADVGNQEVVDSAITSAIKEVGDIHVLINCAGLALGAPASFADLKLEDITTMLQTNINGLLWVTHTVLNKSMRREGEGTILNITSVTGLEVPPFVGESIYHASKAFQEAFTNVLRNELSGTNIRVLALRPGCVATNFHSQRVGHDKEMYDSFFEGFQPLVPEDIADSALYMLKQPLNVSIKAMDVVPSAQRSLPTFDRTWNERNS